MNLEAIKKIIKIEYDAIGNLHDNANEDYVKVLDKLASCKGKVIFMGLGKSGHIGKKLAATFASTGTPSFFAHATEARHGDFGMIENADVVVLMSHSGNTKETAAVIPTLKKISAGVVGFTSGKDSTLAKESDYKLIYPKLDEADPLNLAPTVSSTMMLVLGDALACVLSEKRNFTKDDFYVYHPGGSLGEQLKGDR